jgi:hypothetical protein
MIAAKAMGANVMSSQHRCGPPFSSPGSRPPVKRRNPNQSIPNPMPRRPSFGMLHLDCDSRTLVRPTSGSRWPLATDFNVHFGHCSLDAACNQSVTCRRSRATTASPDRASTPGRIGTPHLGDAAVQFPVFTWQVENPKHDMRTVTFALAFIAVTTASAWSAPRWSDTSILNASRDAREESKPWPKAL